MPKQSDKHCTPKITHLMESDKEIRFELPFEMDFENLLYIGVVRHDTWQVTNHHHEHFELCYVERGQGWFTVNDLLYKVSQGDLFLTKPGESHQGAAAGEVPFRLYYLGFNLEQMRRLEVEYYRIGFNRVERDENHFIKNLFDSIVDEVRMNRQLNKMMVEGMFIQLLVTIVRIYNAGNKGQTEGRKLAKVIIEILNYLHSDIRADHNISDLSQRFHISHAHLAREFKQHMGVNIGVYMRLLCLDKAKHLLRKTNEPVCEIAEKLNFTSIHSFSIFFKRHTGIPPVEYRKQHAGS